MVVVNGKEKAKRLERQMILIVADELIAGNSSQDPIILHVLGKDTQSAFEDGSEFVDLFQEYIAPPHPGIWVWDCKPEWREGEDYYDDEFWWDNGGWRAPSRKDGWPESLNLFAD